MSINEADTNINFNKNLISKISKTEKRYNKEELFTP